MNSKKKVFLSYGHDKHNESIKKIKLLLEKKGLNIWMDSEKIMIQDDWEISIEKALDESDVVLFCITPHSSRRPDGFCLNELSYAQIIEKPIVPIMIEYTHPPLSICRIQYLDLQIFIKEKQFSNTDFKQQINYLAKILNGDKELSFEGKHFNNFKLIEPINFEKDINRYIKNFTGRQWIYDKVNNWLIEEINSRVLYIIGDPGFGKSAISAYLSFKHPSVIGVHFCQYYSDQTKKPLNIIRSFAYQLSTQLPEYAEILNKTSFNKELISSNIHDLFVKILQEPLSKINIKKDLIFIIDAIDEADDGDNILKNLIAREFPNLPNWINVIITSRDEYNIKRILSNLNPIKLQTDSLDNKTDLKLYITENISNISITQNQIDKLIKKSEGNILYLKEIINELKYGKLSLNKIDYFPQGLEGIYEEYFSRNFSNINNYENNQLPLIELLIATKKPFDIEVLLEILNINIRSFYKIIEPMGSLILESNKKISFFHKSIYDWITDKASIKYIVDKKEGHQKIIRYMKNKSNLKKSYLFYYLFNSYINLSNYKKAVDTLNSLDDKDLEKFANYSEIIYYRRLLNEKLLKKDAKNLSKLAKYEYFYGNFKKSIYLYKEAIETSKNEVDLIEYNMNLGKANRNLLKTNKALNFYKKALVLSKEKKDNIKLNEQYGNLGNLYRAKCQYLKSIKLYKKAITFSKKNQGINLSTHYSNISIANYDIGKLKKSKDLFLKSLKKEKGNRRKIITKTNLALTLLDLGENNYAYQQIQEAIEIEGAIVSNICKVYCDLAKGRYLLLNYDYSNAEKKYKNSLKTSNELNAIREQNRSYTWLAIVFYLQNNYKNALIYSKKSLDYYSKHDYHFSLLIYSIIEARLNKNNHYIKDTIKEAKKILTCSDNFYRAHYSIGLCYLIKYLQYKKVKNLKKGIKHIRIAYSLTNKAINPLNFYLRLLAVEDIVLKRIKKEILKNESTFSRNRFSNIKI